MDGSARFPPGACWVCLIWLVCFFPVRTESLGSMSGLAAIYNRGMICGILPGDGTIQCWTSGTNNTSDFRAATFVGISGGNGFFCGIRQSTGQPFCWASSNTASPKRLSSNNYTQIAVGDRHFCGIRALDNGVDCWRTSIVPPSGVQFTNITSGSNFSCGIVSSNRTVLCWGDTLDGFQPVNSEFSLIVAGSRHVCGLYSTFGSVTYCWGNNTYNQTTFPSDVEFSQFALGERHSCGVDRQTRFVVCWGDNSTGQLQAPEQTRFDSITAGDSYTCGVRTGDHEVICWGDGFNRTIGIQSLPGSCTSVTCPSESYEVVNSSSVSNICGVASRHVCVFCSKCPQGALEISACGRNNSDRQCTPGPGSGPVPSPSPPPPARRRKKGLTTIEIVSIVLGSTGLLLGVVAVVCCSWTRFFNRESNGRIHHSVNANNGSVTFSQQQQFRRQRSGASNTFRSQSRKSIGRAEALTLEELALATDNFSDDNRIGTGSFGTVYRGVLSDGREVAIKRGSTSTEGLDSAAKKRFQDREAAFQSELEFLTRLHHRHLVTLVGFCSEGEERLLVYDFMPNGTVHDHLHGRKQEEQEAETTGKALTSRKTLKHLNSWRVRIGIALQAARGIEYLHTYAVPPIIHRDIKSSNILLDSDGSARVSDFGLSLMGPSDEESHLSLTVAGTVGYMDPEYYRLQHLTTKSDVYSFGVVLLELLTGKRAIIVENQQKQEDRQLPVNVVDFAVPHILAGQVHLILDPRVQIPRQADEMEAVILIAELAEECVRLEGRERPTMTEIVGRLENVFAVLTRRKKGKRSVSGLLKSSSSSSSGGGETIHEITAPRD